MYTVTCFLILQIPGPNPLGKTVLFSSPPKTLEVARLGEGSSISFVWQHYKLLPETITTFSKVLESNKIRFQGEFCSELSKNGGIPEEWGVTDQEAGPAVTKETLM